MGFIAPKSPPPPPAPPPPPKPEDKEVEEAKKKEEKRIRGMKGRESTILTSAFGIREQAPTIRKTLLGQ